MQITQPEVERIGIGRERKLVEKRLVGERVLHSPRRAYPRRAQRRIRQAVRDRQYVRKCVRDRRIVENGARTHAVVARQIGEIGRYERHGPGHAVRNIELRVPRRDTPVGVQSDLQVDQRWRPFGIPAMLVGTHPLHAYGSANSACEQRRVAGGIFMTVPSITAGAVYVDGAHVVVGQRKHRCELLAQIVCRLARGPARKLALVEVRNGA